MHHSTHSETNPIARALAFAAGVLPDQGPIGVFVHHNTLHALQHLPFHEAVQKGAKIKSAAPYLSSDEFRSAFSRGRIHSEDVDAAIGDELERSGEENSDIITGLNKASLWRTLMVSPLDTTDVNGLKYVIKHGQSPVCSDLSRWEAAVNRIGQRSKMPPCETVQHVRHRDVLFELDAGDPDLIVHPELTRLCSGFLDQGQAQRALPGRAAGFLQSVAQLYLNGSSEPRGCRGVANDLREVAANKLTAHAVIEQTLEDLGVKEGDKESYILATALALPGWAGMFSRLERHPEEQHAHAPAKLEDFIAVRLLFDSRAIRNLCDHASLPIDWSELVKHTPQATERDPMLDALLLWGITANANIETAAIAAISDEQLQQLWNECCTFPDVRRRKVWQEAYERQYRRQTLDALAVRRSHGLHTFTKRRLAQIVFCIDEREESIRRAIEEEGSDFETFGVAGFFGVAIDYQGLYDRHPAAHCPVVVTPSHEVHEQAHPNEKIQHDKRVQVRERLHRIERMAWRSSRTLSGGIGASLLLGPLAGATAASRIVAPRQSLALREQLGGRVARRPKTVLSSLRDNDESRSTRGKHVGFSIEESAERVAGLLRSIGLTQDFASVVIVLGHGSTSLNNPHESAHDCGACGGRRGGANARLFAELANRADIRALLTNHGIVVPTDTVFVGGLHDTADDKVTLYDTDAVPSSLSREFADTCAMLERARRESARERARRFEAAKKGLSPQQALIHVEERASHLAQPRPEYGHCTNAIAVVGRRALTRGLHLDRRAFLVSYDPSIDGDYSIIERILTAVGPVGAGISLEYFFSSVDNERYGCGTKLPHNVTALLGVMNGHQGDLRTGLPLQMVELHEPMRLLLIVEATTDALLHVAGRQAEVKELVVNEWVQLVSVHPVTGDMQVFQNGTFVPYASSLATLPEVSRSFDWHGNSSEFVSPALINAATSVHA